MIRFSRKWQLTESGATKLKLLSQDSTYTIPAMDYKVPFFQKAAGIMMGLTPGAVGRLKRVVPVHFALITHYEPIEPQMRWWRGHLLMP